MEVAGGRGLGSGRVIGSGRQLAGGGCDVVIGPELKNVIGSSFVNIHSIRSPFIKELHEKKECTGITA